MLRDVAEGTALLIIGLAIIVALAHFGVVR